ncbi:MAG TPA: GFA family protein, partial [Burkholderiales bacterium]|nr:GFA family protein [Burkholderiales bacterium]
MSTAITGGCLCGAVRYEIGEPITSLRACHCVNCQKSSGTGGTVNAVVPSAAFKITQGTPKRYDDSATRSGRTLSRFFCGECGSPVYSRRNPDPGFLVVRAGTIDDSSGMKITGHIWTSTARSWAYIDRSAECHPENLPPPAPQG